MTRVRRCVIGGLIVIAATVSGGASAQDCPAWLKWACPGSASSNRAAGEGVRREQQPSRAPAKQARPAADGATLQKRRPPEATRAAKTDGDTRSGEASGDRRLARHGERQGARLDPAAMNDREKEALFQEFVEWQKARRLNAETDR
jgi:CelD/BcsL family acetyltransferase involved in cellulose biosynthesis